MPSNTPSEIDQERSCKSGEVKLLELTIDHSSITLMMDTLTLPSNYKYLKREKARRVEKAKKQSNFLKNGMTVNPDAASQI